MALVNNAETIGKSGKNLVLETAGHIYVKVNERYYELDFKNSGSNGKLSGRPIVNETIQPIEEVDLSDYITNEDLKRTLKKYVTERSWQDVMATQTALQNSLLDFEDAIRPITVQTMQVVVGSQELQFDWIKNFTTMDMENTYPPLYIDETPNSEHYGQLVWNPGYIKHYTLDGPDKVQPESDGISDYSDNRIKEYWRWYIMNSEGADEIEEINLSDTFYVYLKVPYSKNYIMEGIDTEGLGPHGANVYVTENNTLDLMLATGNMAKTGIGKVIYSHEAIKYGPEIDQETGITYYYLLYAIVTNSDGTPSIATLNGFTEILPGQIRAYLFASPDGESYLDLKHNQLKLGDKFGFNLNGQGDLYIKGAIVQDKGGNSQPTTIYRGDWNINDQYCPGNIVIREDESGVTGSYRFTGIVPEGKTKDEVPEYERLCGTAGDPTVDIDHWICISKGSISIVTAGLYYIDSDDDFTAIPTDEYGTIQASINPWIMNLHMFEGSSQIAITKVDISIPQAIQDAVSVIHKGGGAVEIAVRKGEKIEGTHKITFTVTGRPSNPLESDVERAFLYTISGVQNADPNTMYFLQPSVSQIKKGKEINNVHSYSPTEISCSVFKNNPNWSGTLTSLDSNMEISYAIDGGSFTSYTYESAISTSQINSKIEFKFTVGGVLYDRETIIVVEDGENGKSVQSIVEFYYASASPTSYPQLDSNNWSENKIPNNYGPNSPYLWNYEAIYDNKGNLINTVSPSLICVYGKDGAGIDRIINYYFVTTNTDAPSAILDSNNIPHDSDNTVWKTSPRQVSHDKDHPYLWNVEVIHFEVNEDGSTKAPMCTEPAIIGVFTVDGINAGLVTLTASSYVFSYPSQQATIPTNETIEFNAYKQNAYDATYTWTYTNPSLNGQYNALPNRTTGSNYILNYDSSIFNNNNATIRVSIPDPNKSDSVIFDEITIFKVYASSGLTFTSYLENPCLDIPVRNGSKVYINAKSRLHVVVNGNDINNTEYTVTTGDSDVKWDSAKQEVYINSTSKSPGRYSVPITITYNQYKQTLNLDFEIDNDGYVELSYNTSAFVWDNVSQTYNPSGITISAKSYNQDDTQYTGSYTWEYLNASGIWTKIIDNTSTITIYATGTYFNGRTATIRCVDSTLDNDYDTATFFLVKDGSSTYRLDLSNEGASVPADANGNIQSIASLSCTATLYYGSSIASGAIYELNKPSGTDNVSIDSSTGVLTFANNFTFSGDSTALTINAKINNATVGTSTMNISKVKTGANGEPAVVYWLAPDADKISVDKNGNYSPNTINVKGFMQLGNANVVDATGVTYWYGIDSTSAGKSVPDNKQLSESILKSATSYITLEMYKDGKEIDHETIPIVKDGDDGDPAFSVFLTNPNHVFAGTDTAAVQATDTVGVLVYEGDKLYDKSKYYVTVSNYSPLTATAYNNTSTYIDVNGTHINVIKFDINSSITKAEYYNGGNATITVQKDNSSGVVLAKLNYNWTVSWSGSPGGIGSEGPITRVRKFQATPDSGTLTYNDGTIVESGKKYLDFVFYNNYYYQCIRPQVNVTSAINPSNTSYWSLINNFKPIATSVLLVGDNATGWIIDEGVITHTSNSAKLDKFGNIYLGNSSINDNGEHNPIDKSNAKFQVDGETGDVSIVGSLTIEGNNKIELIGYYIKDIWYNSSTNKPRIEEVEDWFYDQNPINYHDTDVVIQDNPLLLTTISISQSPNQDIKIIEVIKDDQYKYIYYFIAYDDVQELYYWGSLDNIVTMPKVTMQTSNIPMYPVKDSYYTNRSASISASISCQYGVSDSSRPNDSIYLMSGKERDERSISTIVWSRNINAGNVISISNSNPVYIEENYVQGLGQAWANVTVELVRYTSSTSFVTEFRFTSDSLSYRITKDGKYGLQCTPYVTASSAGIGDWYNEPHSADARITARAESFTTNVYDYGTEQLFNIGPNGYNILLGNGLYLQADAMSKNITLAGYNSSSGTVSTTSGTKQKQIGQFYLKITPDGIFKKNIYDTTEVLL